MAFKFLEHTADVLFEAENISFEKALEDAAAALSVTVAESVEKQEEFEFTETAENIEELVVATLSRFLVETEIRQMLPGGLTVLSLQEAPGNFVVKVSAWAGIGKQKTIVKGVTYGMLQVVRGPEKCKIRVLLDI
jgi:SHS2 domain-containing protein